MAERCRIVAAGDAAFLIEFEDRIDAGINADATAAADRILVASLPGVLDVVPSFRSVAVYFDPLRTRRELLAERLDALAAVPRCRSVETPEAIRVPVCYGGEFGPDLAEVARFGQMPEPDVVALHAAVTYRVFMLGFAPGFAYMGTVDARIAAPRHGTPRAHVPAGAVGIAGAQTGVYPLDTPGGWQIIGRTPERPFDAGRAVPFLFRPGDMVRFTPIDRDEYDLAVRRTEGLRA